METFKHFVAWIYTRQLPTPSDLNCPTHSRTLISLWMLADRRQIPLLANMCIDGIRDQIVVSWKIPTQELHLIYQKTAEDSCLRHFIIYAIARTSGASMLETADREAAIALWPKEALWDLLKLVWADKSKRLSKADVAKMQLCEYHHHGGNAEKVCSSSLGVNHRSHLTGALQDHGVSAHPIALRIETARIREDDAS